MGQEEVTPPAAPPIVPGSSARGAPTRGISWSMAVPLAAIVGGLAYTLGALSYQVGSSASPGPGLFPVAVGALILLASGWQLAAEIARPSPPPQALGFEWRRVPAVCGAILAFIILLAPAGYVMASAVLCGSLVHILGRRSWWAMLCFALGVAVGSYWFFNLLGVPLPPGPLPF